MKQRKAHIGSVSEGTLLSEDLISAFSSMLAYLTNGKPDASEKELLQTADKWLAEDEEARDEEIGGDIVQELSDALNNHAPAYCYFGSNEGDGASFGFWPCMDQIDELPRVSDPSEVENHRGEECVFVNDHGNVTVYNADGSVAWDCV